MYTVIETTGSDLIDATGRATGPETRRVISRHARLEDARADAYASIRQFHIPPRRVCILDRDGNRVTE